MASLSLVSSNHITLMDLNDAIISGTQPSSPVEGTLWIDSSKNPPQLMVYHVVGGWVTQSLALSTLDPTASGNITTALNGVTAMSNDLVISQAERITVKDDIQDMIGSVPSDTYTLPAISIIDSSATGQLYQIRSSALSVGISTANSSYVAVTNAYTTLSTYLNGLSPLPWNVSSTANLTIDSNWRTNWNAYYASLYALQQATIVATKTYVQSRGENLVTNGTGLLGNNTNFSAFTFDGSDSYFSKGSFKDSSYNVTRFSDEIMPVDVNKTYRLSIWAKANPFISGAHCYLGIAEYDADGLAINSNHHMYIANTLTTLAQTLKPGDTVVYLTSAANWQNAAGAATQNRSIIFWNYTNASGYTWPALTYSRNGTGYDMWADGSVNTTNNTITLRSAWTGATYPAGTQLSNGSSGGTYKYIAAGNVNIPNTWTNYTGIIGGIDNTGNNVSFNFAYGTAGVKLLFLNNRDVTGNTSWFSNISFNVDLASQGSVDTINTTLSNMANDNIITQSERISIKSDIQEMIGSVPSDTYTLPVIATIDTSGAGQLYQVRNAAVAAGVSTGSTAYTNLTNAYGTLQSYLNAMNPLPWNVSSTSNIGITASTWRSNWSAYFAAIYALQQATATALQSNINNVTVGGKNLILASNIYMNTNTYLIKRYSLSEGLIAGQQYTFVVSGSVPAGQKFGIWENAGSNNVGYATTQYSNVAGVTYVTFTAVAPTAGNTNLLDLYNYPSSSTTATVNWVALYKGNKPMDWSPAPEDSKVIGNRNYLRNSGQFVDTTDWSLNIGSACVGQLNVYTDATYGNVLDATLTTNATSGNNWYVIQNNALTLPNGKFTIGNVYTFSALINTAYPLTINFKNSDGTNPVSPINYAVSASAGTWQKIVWTFQATATGATPMLYISKGDSTSTGECYIAWVQIEDGTSASGWGLAPEDLQNQISTLQGRVSNVESGIDGDTIVNTVTTSVSFTNALSGKADSTDLNGYATPDDVTAAQTAAQAYADSQIKGLNLDSTYVTTFSQSQTNTDLNTKISSSGGVNMLLNSIGFSADATVTPPVPSFWTVALDAGGAWKQDNSLDMQALALKSGHQLIGAKLTQNVAVTPGFTYTLSALVKKTNSAGSGYISIYETINGVKSTVPAPMSFASGTTEAYLNPDGTPNLQSVNIIPTGGTVTVEIYADVPSGGITFTGIMLNIGKAPFQWTQAPTEIYNSNINMDINGIRVMQTDPNNNNKPTGYTVMTPSKFAGYTDVNGDGVIDQTTGSSDEVFRMDKDTFVMKTATIKPIKIVPVTSGGHNGIAFVPS